MATRTPPQQTRSQFTPKWGNYASGSLPNQSGNPLGAPFFVVLEVGDLAYDTTEAELCVCTNVGTVGGGDATWTPVAPSFQQLAGPWSPTETFTIPTGSDLDTLNPGEVYCAVLQPYTTGFVSLLQTLISNAAEFAPGGWELGYNGTRPRYAITDGAFARLENFGNGFPPGIFQGWTVGFYSFGFDGANRFIKQAGRTIRTDAMTGYTGSALGVALGVHASLATSNDALTSGRILGVAAKTDGILTDAQHIAIVDEFLRTGDLPDSAFTSRWSVRTQAVGQAPAVLPDLIGANDFTRVGTQLAISRTAFAGITQVQVS